MRIAIVTGASSGLGRAFVRQIGRDERLDEIWVIARREGLLQSLQDEVQTRLRPFPLDLTRRDSIRTILKALLSAKPDVQYLVNCAGFGMIGYWGDVSVDTGDDLIDLNCRALVDMTVITLPYMQRGSRLLQIASVSAFQPFPALNLYAASKAFVLRYTRALRWELKGQGIRVTAVCPYWLKDTEFIEKAQKTRHGDAIRHFPLSSTAAHVAALALRDNRLGLAVSTPGIVCTVQRFFAKFIPHSLMIWLWEGIRRL